MAKYKKAEYESVMKCPECGYKYCGDELSMPEPDGFMNRTDDDGIDYVECSCGCKFIEE